MISIRKLVVHKFLVVFLLYLAGASAGRLDESGQLEHEARSADWAPHIWRSFGTELLPASSRLSPSNGSGLMMARLAKRTRFKPEGQTSSNEDEDIVLSRQHLVDDQAGQLQQQQRRQHLIENLVLQQSASRNEGEFWVTQRDDDELE